MMFFENQIKHYLYWSGVIPLLFYFSACNQKEQVGEVVWTGYTMGTSYQVKVAGEQIPQDTYQRLAQLIDSALADVNHQMSTYLPRSEISEFNRSRSTEPFQVSAGFMTVIREAVDLYQSSHGAFDATVEPLVNLWGFGPDTKTGTVPPEDRIQAMKKIVGSSNLEFVDSLHIRKKIPELQLDLSAIAKGYGVDIVAGLLSARGYRNHMVEIGGEVVAGGLNAKLEPWKIGIDRPKYANLPGQELEGILELKDVAVATSGDYRNYFESKGKKYSHTIDPATGRPVTHDLASVTIVADNCTKADGIATTVMVLGPDKGLSWLERMNGIEGLLIVRRNENDFEEHQTPGFSKYLTKSKY
jgi:thiamine biosynthesis lipoprotein